MSQVVHIREDGDPNLQPTWCGRAMPIATSLNLRRGENVEAKKQNITLRVNVNTTEYEEQLFKVSQAVRKLQIEVDTLNQIELKATIE
jgi:hypothetical protein